MKRKLSDGKERRRSYYSALTLNSDYTSLVTKTWYALISLIVI